MPEARIRGVVVVVVVVVAVAMAAEEEGSATQVGAATPVEPALMAIFKPAPWVGEKRRKAMALPILPRTGVEMEVFMLEKDEAVMV